MESLEARASRIIAGLVDIIDTLTDGLEALQDSRADKVLASIGSPESMAIVEEAGAFAESVGLE